MGGWGDTTINRERKNIIARPICMVYNYIFRCGKAATGIYDSVQMKDSDRIFKNIRLLFARQYAIMNPVQDLTHADREACIKGFPSFMEHHDACIRRMILTAKYRNPCFGLVDFAV